MELDLPPVECVLGYTVSSNDATTREILALLIGARCYSSPNLDAVSLLRIDLPRLQVGGFKPSPNPLRGDYVSWVDCLLRDMRAATSSMQTVTPPPLLQRQGGSKHLRLERIHRWLDGERWPDLFDDPLDDKCPPLLSWMPSMVLDDEPYELSWASASVTADRLESWGHDAAAASARQVASNFALAARLRAQEVARSGIPYLSPLASSVQGMAEWGLVYMTAFEACRERDLRRLDALWLLALLHPDLLDAGDAWLAVRRVARELNAAEIPDAPHRALPRETRAGPVNDEPEKSPLQ